MGLENILFNDLCNTVARHLPQGWEITLALESGYGGLKLVDPDGDDPELSLEGNDYSLEEQVQICVDFARVTEELPPHFDPAFDRSDWE